MGSSGELFNIASHATFFDWAQLIALFLSVLVAGLAASYAIRDGRRNQQRSEFTVSPAVTFERNATTNCENIGVQIKNQGIGPAIIDKIFFLFHGIPMDITSDLDWWQAYDGFIKRNYSSLHKELATLEFNFGGLESGEILGAGGIQNIASIPNGTMSNDLRSRYVNFTMNSEVIVFYHSVHDRRFVSAAGYMPQGNLDASLTPEEWIKKYRSQPEGGG